MKRRDFLTSCLVGLGAVAVSGKGRALEFFPNPSEKKWAVLYGTRYGSTRDAGIWISEGMGGIADVFDAREKPDLEPLDFLVVGSGIYGGRIADPLDAYIAKNQKSIQKKVKGVFVVCGATGEAASGYIDSLAAICKVESPVTRAFRGRITKGLLNQEDLKGLEAYYSRVERPFEDYDNLSRPECLGFGKEILTACSSGGAE